MPDTTAICLDTNLLVADVGLLGNGLDAQAGRVGVGADNGDGVARAPLVTDGKGGNRGAVAGKVVFAAGADNRGPRIALLDELEASLFEAGGGRLDGVVGWAKKTLAGFQLYSKVETQVLTSRRSIDKVDKVERRLGWSHDCWAC